jgi:hypothetical protein
MLDSHEGIAIPPETGFLRLVTAHRWVPYWEFGGEWHERLELTAADVDRRLAGLYGEMFARYAERHGARRWGEKTPFHLWHIDDIRRLFPDAFLLAIVRHPFGAVGSAIRRFDRRPEKAVRHWLGGVRELVGQSVTVGDRLAFIRYEDLTRDPEPAMREVLAWLGEPWSPAVLRHHEVQASRGGPTVAEGGTRTDRRVDDSHIDRWKEWFDPAERELVERRTAVWARLLGYADEPTTPPERLAGGDRRLLFTGSELAARAATFEGLDRTPPDRPAADDPILPTAERMRERALGRGGVASSGAARRLFERLPPKAQRRMRKMRRARRRRHRTD